MHIFKKYLIFLIAILFIFIFWLCQESCEILVPWPGIELMPPALEAWGLNHWTSRKSQMHVYIYIFCIYFLNDVFLAFSLNNSKKILFIYLFLFYLFIFFTILHWFCHTLTWIRHGCTCVPHPELPSHLPPHPIPLVHPSAPAQSTLYHASNKILFIRVVLGPQQNRAEGMEFFCIPPVPTHVPPPPIPASPAKVLLLQLMNIHWHTNITQSPQFTLGFTWCFTFYGCQQCGGLTTGLPGKSLDFQNADLIFGYLASISINF